MYVAVGVWIAFAGALALLVGLSARYRVRHLRSSGIKVWAMVVHHPVIHSPEDPDRGPMVALQYTLEDGRVLERPLMSSRARSMVPGEKILVWYNPDDPGEILVFGRDARVSDVTFISVGLVVLAAGIVLAVVAP